MLAIRNTSPLLYLHQVSELDLLRQLYGRVRLPPAVATELKAGGAVLGIAVPSPDAIDWLEIRPVRNPDLIPLINDLGPGEAEAIALGLEHPGSLIILDDQLGRRIGQAAGLRITVTLGVLLKAKRSGLIPSVAAILSKLRMAGMWIGDDLTAEVIGVAGE
jgi:predicted nucleic acid-binding protein